MDIQAYKTSLDRMSREQLAEELVYFRTQSLSTFRNDEGTEYDDRYCAFWKQLRALEAKAREVSLTAHELADARARVEARENFYRRLFHPRARVNCTSEIGPRSLRPTVHA
jgi:hypothetical protein